MLISPTDSNITYIGRWADKQFSGIDTKIAVSNGGKFRFKFTGTSLTLNFKLTTEAEQPRISYSLNSGSFSTSVITSSVTIATGLANATHTVELYCDSTYYSISPTPSNSWNTGEALMFQGAVIDDGASLIAWPTGLPKFLIFGDSISEGLKMLANNEAVANSSGRQAWGNVLGGLIGAEPHIIAYGSQGVTQGGRRGVPKAIDAYPYKMLGVAQTDPQAAGVIIAHGANDGSADSATFKTQYRAYLDAVRAAQPTAHFYLFPPFSLATHHQADILAVQQEAAYSSFCTYVDPSAWIVSTTEGVHPDVAGHVAIAGYLADTIGTIPTITLDSSTISTQSSTATLTGTMSEGAVVTVTGATAVISYPSATTWRAELSGLAAGSNSITVTATANGLTTSAVATVTYTPATINRIKHKVNGQWVNIPSSKHADGSVDTSTIKHKEGGVWVDD